ncbi:MAG: hypothetical protein KME08_09515 [Aphanothece sp. CMT-3BRIN-NPC111]|nr:hypothetical protein [Aphanothece sp. CMT-3BRIN-NPC111]
MLRRIWQWLKRLFQRLLNIRTPPQSSPDQRERGSIASPLDPGGHRRVELDKPLNDADYENLFMQLLEGVHQGWSRGKIKGFLLAKSINEAEMVAWLQEFGRKLLESPQPNQELVQRMVRLGELDSGEISKVAYEIGIQRLIKEPKAEVWEYDGLDK